MCVRVARSTKKCAAKRIRSLPNELKRQEAASCQLHKLREDNKMRNKKLEAASRRARRTRRTPKSGTRFLLTTALAALFGFSSVSASYAALSNTAEATGTPAAGTLTNPTDTLSLPVALKNPKYTAVKSVVSMTTSNGASASQTDGLDVITYQYVVDNTGNVTLSGVTLTDAGPTFNGNAATNGLSAITLASGDTNNNNLLETTETWTYTATYILAQADVDNSAGVTNGVANSVVASASDPQNVPALQDTGTVLTATATIPAAPALSIDKTADTAGPLTVGQVINYTYLVTNTGNVTISGVDVNETSFNGTGTPVPNPTTAGSTTLAPGGTVTFTASYTVTQADIDTLQ
jgi:uncharacterized repeat protein (TIGR01451 family)